MIKTYKKHTSVIPAKAGIHTNTQPSKFDFRWLWKIILERKILVFSVLFLLVTLPIIYLVIKYRTPIEAAWFDDTFAYRQTVAITNAGTTQTDFQVAITLNTSALITAGKMQSDCDDIRITDISGKLLPIWIETSTNACNTTTTAIWTKVPSISTSGTTVFLYYGNPSAASVQNGNNVFLFFDDFSGSSIDSLKWSQGTVAATTGTSFSQSSGNLNGGNNNRYIQSVNAFTGDYISETRVYTTTPATNGFSTVGFWASTSNNFGVLDHNGTSYYRNDGSWTNFTYNASGQWSRDKVKIVGTSATYWTTGETSGSSTNSITNTGISSEYIRLGARYDSGNYDQNYSATWDWIFVRKAVTTEPSTASPTNEEKSQGPVAYWKFDEGYSGSTKNSTSISALNATLGTNASWKTEDQCISGKCIYIDDTGSSTWETVYATDNSSLGNMSALTVGIWIKTTSNKATQQVIYKRNSTGTPAWWSYKIELNSLKPTFYVINSSATSVSSQSDTVIELNKWYYLTGVYDGSQVQIYVNGKAADSTPASLTGTVLDTDYRLQIGGLDTASTYYVKGYLDEVKIYPYARSAAQIKSDFASKGSGSIKGTAASLGSSTENSDAFSNGLVGYWKMDEAAANSCSGGVNDSCDASGNGNDGAWNGNATSAAGKFGNGTTYDGTGDYANVGAMSNWNPDSGESTVSLWFKASSSGPAANQAIFSDNYGPEMGIWLNSSGNVYGIAYQSVSTSTNYKDNAWHHAVLTFSITQLYVKFYVDGTYIGQTTMSVGNGMRDTPYSLGLDWQNGALASPFTGSIDETRIYNRALSGKEVRDLYTWAPGPVGYFKLDEGTGTSTYDSSGLNHNSTSMTNTTWSTGKFGKSVNFNGSNTNIIVADSADFENKSFTLEAWVYPNGNPSAHKFILARRPGSEDVFYWDVDDSNKLRLVVYDPTYNGTSSTTTVPQNQWSHVAVSYEQSGTAYFYINGIRDTTSFAAGAALNLTSTKNLYFGMQEGGGYPFAGKIDDTRIYNYVRTPGQIVEDMNAGHPLGGSPVGSQVGYWKFDEGQGITANNSGSGGSSLNGSLENMASPPTSISGWNNNGKFGKSISFDGGNDDVSLGSSTTYNSSSFTYTFWIKPNTLLNTYPGSANSNIIMGRENYLNSGFRYGITSTGQVQFWTTQSGGNLSVNSGSTTLSTGSYYHLAITYDSISTTGRLFINGKQVGSNSGTYVVPTGYTLKLIGGIGGVTFPQAEVDEVKIYNAALTEDEIKLDYNHGAAMVLGESVENRDRVTSGQTLYLDATDKTSYPGSGTNWYDLSGNNYNATLSSPTWNGLKFTNTAATLTNLGSSVYPNIATNTTILWVYPEVGSGLDWSVTNSDGNTYMSYTGDNYAYINTWETGGYTQRTVWNVTESVPHQIVITKNGSVRTVYDNMVQKGQVTLTNPATSVNSNIVYGNASRTMGLSIVETYNRVLSTDEITQDYYAHAYKFNINAEPIAEWKMDEKTGTNAYDTSGNGNTGTLTNSPSWSIGKIGSAVSYDATSEHIDLGAAKFDSLTNATVEMWFYYTGTFDANRILFYRYKDSNNRQPIFVSYSGGYGNKLVFENIVGGSNRSITSNSVISTNTWYHATFTCGTGGMKMYINGVQQTSTNVTTDCFSSIAATANNRIGWTSNTFMGKMDNVKIYDYVRTPAQIAYDFNRGGPVGWWKMNECQGITANDSSGNGNSGTITIGATGTNTSAGTCTGSTGEAWKDGATGKFNSSLEFDGADDFTKITSPTGGVLNPLDNITLSAWIYWGGAGTGTPYIISKGWGDVYELTLSSGRPRLEIVYDFATSDYQQVIATTAINQSQWYHIAGTYDKQKLRIYINGVLNNTADYAKSIKQYSYAVKIGSNYQGGEDPNQSYWHMFKGQIDDVKIFNYALTATQIKTLYNSGAAVQFAPTTGSP